jgi:hypothetical protein
MNIEHASLILKPYLLTAGGTNNYGTSNAGRSIYTFTNINLRNVVGNEIFDKYNKFNLILKNVMTEYNTGVNWGNAGADRVLAINLSGFNFISNYDITLKTSSQISTITTLLFNPTGSLNLTYNNNCVASFIITNENIDITVSYQRVSDGTLPAGNFGIVQFIFDIVPITN